MSELGQPTFFFGQQGMRGWSLFSQCRLDFPSGLCSLEQFALNRTPVSSQCQVEKHHLQRFFLSKMIMRDFIVDARSPVLVGCLCVCSPHATVGVGCLPYDGLADELEAIPHHSQRTVECACSCHSSHPPIRSVFRVQEAKTRCYAKR